LVGPGKDLPRKIYVDRVGATIVAEPV
jgi:hypothetical protein